jgi:hypothetical protein
MKFFYRILVCLFALLPMTRAQLLSVDINVTARADNTAPGFTPWNMGTDLTGTRQSVTRSFTNYVYTYEQDTGLPLTTNLNLVIPCTVTMANPATATTTINLNAKNANSTGYSQSTDPSVGWRLPIDGCCVWLKDAVFDQPYTNGGAFSLTISNLPAGVHSITTYHNDAWGAAGAVWHNGVSAISRCIVSANGVPVFTNTPTTVATNDGKCGFAFFYITNSYDGQPVVLNFDPDHSSVLDYAFLNGFDIDRASAPGTTATALFPSVGDEHVFASNDAPVAGTANAGFLTLQWLPAGFAISNYLYLGSNSNAVASATTASPEFKTNNAATTSFTNNFFVTNLNSATTYFWRVDQLNIANGGTNLVKGLIWEFRTRHLAFPGAEGYGRFARGGRGGVVLEVTNLNDSGPGSYRSAIAASGARTVVFRVSGLISLQSACIIGNGYLTIAGQTAPGDGICLRNWRAGMSGPNDVIMRFMRFRTGDGAQQSMDAMSPGSATHTIIDHCSSSWSLDVACNSLQSGSVGSASAMTTYQRNIISEPLRYSYHYNDALRAKGSNDVYQPHAFGASISGEIGSYHHNLIAHSTDRNWSLAGGYDKSVRYAGSLDIRNNVVYNWLGRTTDGGVARCNYVSNYYKPFPSNPYATWLLRLDPINTNNATKPAYYMVGNVMDGKNYQTNNWSIGLAVPFGNGSNNYASSNQIVLAITNAEIFPSFVTTQTASNAFRMVLSDVGCNLPAQDLIDQRVIGEVLDRTTHYIGTNGLTYTINGIFQPDSAGADNPGLIDSQTDVHDYSAVFGAANFSLNYPWAPYQTYNVPEDTDHDGLPDWWELAKGLNPNSAPADFSDSNGDPDGDGYTNLEDYLNWLAAIHVDGTRGTNVDVELTAFTRSFTNNTPTYVVMNPTNGTVSLVNGKIARFTPTANFYGLGSFQFKVTDAQNVSLTNTVGVHVRAQPASQLTATNAGGGVQLRFTGESGLYYLIQTSDNLQNWTSWTNTTATASAKIFTPGNLIPPTRFYRSVSVQ